MLIVYALLLHLHVHCQQNPRQYQTQFTMVMEFECINLSLYLLLFSGFSINASASSYTLLLCVAAVIHIFRKIMGQPSTCSTNDRPMLHSVTSAKIGPDYLQLIHKFGSRFWETSLERLGTLTEIPCNQLCFMTKEMA